GGRPPHHCEPTGCAKRARLQPPRINPCLRKQSIAIRTTSPHSVQGAELVAVDITQIGEIELPRRAFPHTRWVFAGSSAVCDADRMPSVSLLSRTGGKADRAAIGRSRRFAIDRLGY